jgi:coenzyme PQQ biosynthesis protein PqqD
MIKEEQRPILAPGVRMQNDRLRGKPVLLYPEGILELNETASELVERCNGRNSIADTIAALTSEYDCGADDLRADILSCLEEFHRRKLIVFK